MDGDEGVVVDVGARAPVVELRVDLARVAEEDDCLVDQVAPEVEQDPACLLGLCALPPAGSRDGTPALEARLEARDAPDRSFAHEPLDGAEVPVPAAIVIRNREQPAGS